MSAIVFDLDGTLVDSAAAIRDIANTLMAELGFAPLDADEVRTYVGDGAPAFLERALAARGANDPAAMGARLARYQEIYAAAPGDANRPFPGVDSALRRLRAVGHRLGLCTNKPGLPTQNVIHALGWASLIEAVVAGDTLTVRKPNPEPLLEAVRLLGGGPAFYVGDSEIDAAAAAAAGMPFLLHTEGYRKASIDSLPRAAEFASFAELPSLVAELAAMSAASKVAPHGIS